LEYGWVNLNTGHNTSTVSTPGARAVVGGDSEAVVAYDRQAEVSQFSAYRGEVAVASQTGTERTLEALQTVTQTGDLLSETRALPAAPDLISPPNNTELVHGTDAEVVLSWAELPDARGYALQVTRNRLFVDNLVDVADRRNTRATLGIQGEGSFLWRVAAVTNDDLVGPWSEPRHFIVSSAAVSGDEQDKTPPLLELDEIQSYGSIFIVNGRTDPGAKVTINGELVQVEADGSFTKTVQLEQQGWDFLDVTATDNSGNETVQRHRVFVETA
jgi:hypothetical protein